MQVLRPPEPPAHPVSAAHPASVATATIVLHPPHPFMRIFSPRNPTQILIIDSGVGHG